MRPLAEWDGDYLDVVAQSVETTNFEKKASAKFGFTAKGKVTEETKQEIAKQVCAFANSGEGYLVYGVSDGGGLDGGVPNLIGRQSIKDWFEALIPTLHHPPIEGCEARFIHLQTHHDADKGVLVVAVPLSERRPHWMRDEEKAYLRVGAHSAPMRPQTLLDISSRGVVPRGRIVDLGLKKKPQNIGGTSNPDKTECLLNPIVLVEGGQVCEMWGLEIQAEIGGSSFDCYKVSAYSNNTPMISGYNPSELGVTIPEDGIVFIQGKDPLFPMRPTHVFPRNLGARLVIAAAVSEFGILARFFASSALPVEKRYNFILGASGDWVAQ